MADWLAGSVGYEVYLRSFADSDGDGVGDLEGLRRRLDHLADLGVDVVWITPCYPSPQADHGYDVSDYTDIDPTFGDLATLDAVVADAHARGLKVLMDLVPNHTSSQHPWFQRALADPDAPERGYYLFRDPAPDGGPPNNWRSHFGGPAWTLDPASGQYWCHLFLPEQPDLDWSNPAVRAAFDDILRFWFERGVDGFRIDVAHSLAKDPELRDNPPPPANVDLDASPLDAINQVEHLHDLDQPGVVEIYERWRRICDEYDTVILGEVYLLTADHITRYVADGRLHGAFYFPALKTGWDATAMARALRDGVAASRGRFAWPMSSHDDPRAATRFGGGRDGAERLLAYAGLLAGLPGTLFLYQGDELGLDDAHLPTDVVEDPAARGRPGARSRDGSRTPIPWTPGPLRGFTTGGSTWLPIPDNHGDERSVAAQEDDPASILHRTRALLHTRRQLAAAYGDGPSVVWLPDHPHVVGYRRGQVVVALNVGGAAAEVELPVGGTIAWASRPGATLSGDRLTLPTDVAVHVRLLAMP